jgi:hypothetical protein
VEGLVVIEQPQVSVAPGGTAQVDVRLVNNGSVVEGYDLTVLGAPSAWSDVAPAHVELMPRTDITVALLFRPPSGPSAPAGRFPFAIKATSTRDGTSSSVEEGVVEVGAEVRLAAELRPSSTTGFRSGRFRLSVRNDGNSASRVRVTARDPAEVLRLQVRPDLLDVPAGGASTAEVRVRAPLNFGGSSRQHQVVVDHAELQGDAPTWAPAVGRAGPTGSQTGRFDQRRALGRQVKVAALLVLLAGAGAVGAKLLLRPPATPTQLKATGSTDTSVTLQWTGVKGAGKYRLNAYDGDFDAAPALEPKIVEEERPQPSTSFEQLASGKTYCFTVQAINGRGTRSKPSEKACQATAGKAAIEAPTDVTASTLDGKTATVTWKHPSGPSLGYRILVNGEKKSDIEPGAPLQAVVDLKAGADNQVAVLAFSPGDPKVTSPASAAVPVTPGFEVLVAASNIGSDVQAANAAFPGEVVARTGRDGLVSYFLNRHFASPQEATAYCTDHGWDPATHACVAVPLGAGTGGAGGATAGPGAGR